MSDGKSWFLEKQQQVTDRVGEPVLLVVKMPFDAWFEVEINTFTGRMGMATGQEVETAVEQAVDMLLEMDEVIAEVVRKRRQGQNAESWIETDGNGPDGM